MIALGLMAGTSLDGIDVARVEIVPRRTGYRLRTLDATIIPLPAQLRTRLVDAFPPHRLDALEFARLHADVGSAFGDAACALGVTDVDFVASHGITLAHAGSASLSWQLGDPFRIRERIGRTVVSDFRSADTAAGGQGAPLVPLVDARLFASASEHRATLNLGGIANLTILPAAAAPERVLGFDSGPANMLVDAYCMLRSGGNEHYDRDGARALRGRVDEQLLTRWLAHPYFASPPPKSTGREQFGAAFLTAERQALDVLAFDDAIATLTALSVRTIAAALLRVAPRTQRMIASGGGVHNGALMSGLRAALPDITLETSSAYGIDPDAKEAIAFALLGYEALRGRALPLASVTGARGARVLGAIAPVELSALIGRLQAEEGAND